MDLNEEFNINLENNISYNPNNQLLNEQKTHSQLKQYYKDLKLLVSKRPINPKGKSELSQFKKKIIDLIKEIFKDKNDLFCSVGKEIDLQLFLEYLFQLLQKRITKMVEGYKLFEKIDNNQLLLVSKTKNTIISFLISFYDFYEDELVINNEEVVAEIIDNRENLEESFVIILIKTINLLNIPYITKDEFINMFNQEKKSKIFSFKSKDLGYLFLKIIELFFKIRSLNNSNLTINKKRLSIKNQANSEINDINEDSRKSSLNKGDIQFTTFLGICFEKIVPCIIEIFSNVILEYDIRNTINIIIKKNELDILFNNFNHIRIIRNKIFNIILSTERIFNKEESIYIQNLVLKMNLIENALSYMNKDIHGNKYNSLRDFLFEIKKVIKYYLVYLPQSEEIDTKIISVVSLGIAKIKNKNIKMIKIQNNVDIIISFLKDINKIQNEYQGQKYKVFNFFIFIFQSSSLLRKYVYKILLDNFSGDFNNYQDMLGQTKFLSLFIGNLCNCDGEIIDYFFGFLHSFDKFNYFPNLELTNIISSLTCFTNEKSVQILMNNLEIYNKINEKEKIEKDISTRKNSIKGDNIFKEQINELMELNKNFLDIFSNIINDILIKYNEDKKTIKKDGINININNNVYKILEQRNVFSAKMIIPLLEYISKVIIHDSKIYQYFIEKNFIVTLNQFFNINDYKVVAYNFIELLIKSAKNKNMNEDRIKVILNRIDLLLNNKNENKKYLQEFEKLKELILILKSINTIISNDILPEKEINFDNKKDIRYNILLGLNKCFNYFKKNKEIINVIFNEKYHSLVKEYLNTFLELFISHNKNCIIKKNENSLDLNKELFQLMITNILDLYKLIAQNNKLKDRQFFLFDIIIFFINKSLNINSTKEILTSDDMTKYYMNLLSIDEIIITDETKTRTMYSNIFIYNPFLLTTILIYLIKENIYLETFLNLLYFLLKINKSNIPILLKHNIIYYLLEIPISYNKYNNILYKIFTFCFPLMQKSDLRVVFEYLIKSYNTNKLNFTKDILKCLIDSIQGLSFNPKKYGKGIYLSGYAIKQPNIYNLINLTNITFNNYANESIFFVKEEILFHDQIENNKLILFRMDKKTGNNTQFLEISIINGNLTASENIDNEERNEESINEKNEMQINARNFININELNNFIFKFDNNEKILSVIINRKNIFSYPYKFSFNQNILRTKLVSDKKKINNINNLLITVGYPFDSLINIEDHLFHELPYIKILSLTISEEKPGKDDKKNIINIYEMKINTIFKDSNKSNKNEYFDLTQFRLDKRTLLKSKYNSYEAFLTNSIMKRYNIKTQLYNNLIFIQKYLLDSLDYNFRIEKYLFILLSANNMDKEMFYILIKLLSLYVISNNEILSSFVQKEELSSTFYFILLKNVKYINSEIIEMIFSCFLSQKNNSFVINVFLDYRLFESLEIEAQKKALELIINKKLTKGKQDFIELLLKKLSLILLLCDFEEKEENFHVKQKGIDELIISIMIGILSKNDNNMVLYSFVEIVLFNLCKFHTIAKEHMEKSNKGRQEDTHFIITNFFNKLYNSVSVIKIKDLLKKYIQSSKNLEINYKNKFIQIINSYKPINLSSNINVSFRDSMKAQSFIKNRHSSFHNSKNFIRNKLDINNQKSNTLEKKETHGPFKTLPKMVNEFVGGLGKNKKTIEKKKTEEIHGNIEIISDNDTWINSEIKNGKLIETEKIICMGNCHLCNFIRAVLDDLFQREIKFNDYEKYLLNNYSETYILNRNLEYKFQFSNYLDSSEGTSRIRNKFKIKVDKVSNLEIQEKKKHKNNNNIKKLFPNELEKITGFYKADEISLNLSNFFNIGQIFEIDYISDCIDKNDTYQYCCNCLLFKGFNYINSVLVLGERQIYILTNMFLDQNLILYNSEKPIKKSFWIIDNYTNMIPEHCKYLDSYDSLNNNSLEANIPKILKKINKTKSFDDEQIKSKQLSGFKFISFSYPRINEIHKKRFLHQNNAVEMFLKTGINYYLVFNTDIRDVIVSKILQNISNSINYINNSFISNSSNNSVYLNEIINYNSQSIKNENMIFMTDSELFTEKTDKKINLVKVKQKNITKNKNKNNCKILDIKDILEQSTEKWSEGIIDTYSYLMILNTLSGRTYNDLNQYPVLPWILSDYSSDNIDLKESNTFRDFSYPIYAQDEESREILKDKYNSFEEKEIKYHSGSHYSNPAFVCYYLIRTKPFSISASEIQGGCFDAPDRLFFDIDNFYKISAKYQELIPDFFNLPEIYININNFTYGKNLDGIQVNDVILPSWSKNSPRIFSKMNKKALESQFVSLHINNWIDLIYGYKQKGLEAEKAYNVLRDVCSYFNPKDYKDKSEIELKINELCEMGIDPIQLFTKPHPKRERHHIIQAFFGRSAYLTYFAPLPNKYPLKNFSSSSKIKEVRKYYEDISGVLSKGEGGLSSFRMCYHNNEKIQFKEGINDVYIIIDENKILIPPSYKNYIEWGNNNIFSIVKPLKNVKYTFCINHMKDKIIDNIAMTRSGKYIIIGYNNGVIEKYVLQKIDISSVNNNTNNKSNNLRLSTSNDIRLSDLSSQNSNIKGIGKKNVFKKLISGLSLSKTIENEDRDNTTMQNITSTFGKIEKKNFGVINTIDSINNIATSRVKKIDKNPKINKIIFDNHISISFSNILNSDCILLNKTAKKFLQYSGAFSQIFQDNSNSYERIMGYNIHSMNQSELKKISKISNENNIKSQINIKYFIFLVNSSSRIINGISLIEICQSFSFMVVVDKTNKVYLYDFNSFNLMKYIDFSFIFNSKIKSINISPYTGEFILATKRNVALMNINGVILAKIDYNKSKINSCFISLIPNSQNDLYLFTGHEDGDLIIFKLKINDLLNDNVKSDKINEKRVNNIRNVYIDSYNNDYSKYNDMYNLPFIFDTVIKIKCSSNPLKYIKIKEDLTELICIDGANQIIYLSYKEFFNKNKDKKNLKECPICKSNISSSKILCHYCGKKLCWKCKIEEIIPEYSLKNKKPICEDCLQLINSTNKLLYDF